ncbi:phosphotransferase system, enzyme I, PtsP [Limimonas halophila]|uniref:phosphoenolpyruvate--protein phosphotransferase n=1 Tax=Limimonas halophila TaxID=1082479 RepID=A0A1G7PY52_9PROT|nr:phosphoenolpyruvate--protein phosphotransferase [Limimonas halophila]SDF91138.1 phosphotransferase system, enzyme I, PtsP [Limimonas halophila]
MSAQEHATGWDTSRRLLRLLRNIMKEGGAAQDRLDRIVRAIAEEMAAEVCSVYVKRAGEILELFATHGLRADAVHHTRLRVGEGVVGHVARKAQPLRIAEVASHPAFVYRPETGEEPYRALMGVPIMRDGGLLGVLVIQSVEARHYGDEEVEVLETVATLLAELVAGGELVAASESQHADSNVRLPVRLPGMVLCEGLAMGQVLRHRHRPVVYDTVADDPDAEGERLRAAVAEMQSSLDKLLDDADLDESEGEHRDVLASYRMFASDRGWLERMAEAVRTGLTAEAAVQKVQSDTQARMAKARDRYLRERLADLDDLANRLVQHLTGATQRAPMPEDTVLVARTLGPAEFLDYDRSKLRAVVLEEGSPTAHVAVVARALDVPVIGRCRGVMTEARTGDTALVDGETGQVLLRPEGSAAASFAETIDTRRRRAGAAAATGRDLEPVTRDGERVGLHINAGLRADLPHLDALGADGIGLYRTEVPFMVRRSFPGVDEQARIYGHVLARAGDRPVVFRTLDVGGDKILPYWRTEDEDNPAMGRRALRLGLDRPHVLRRQVRALIRASAGRELHIMLPMVSQVWEVDRARELIDRERALARERGQPGPSAVRLGAMLEVPALCWQLPRLLERVDFIALGSNDLVQFVFAADRGNPQVTRRYDPLSPPVMKLTSQLVAETEAAGVPLSVCGEMAGNPLEAMALIGCGVRRLSMAPRAMPGVRAMLRSVDTGPLSALLRDKSDSADASLRPLLQTYASDHGIEI